MGGLSSFIRSGEIVVADAGYSGDVFYSPEAASREFYRFARAHHELLNGRLKSFNVLRHIYRHNLRTHALCFHAVAQLVQVALCNGKKLMCV